MHAEKWEDVNYLLALTLHCAFALVQKLDPIVTQS